MSGPHAAPGKEGRLQRILGALTRRSPAPPPPDLDRWSPDDLAECIFDGPWRSPRGDEHPELVRGHVAIVREVRFARDMAGHYREFLIFARWPKEAFAACGFRKLTPRADAIEAADAAFVDQLKSRTVPSPPATLFAARLKRIFQ